MSHRAVVARTLCCALLTLPALPLLAAPEDAEPASAAPAAEATNAREAAATAPETPVMSEADLDRIGEEADLLEALSAMEGLSEVPPTADAAPAASTPEAAPEAAPEAEPLPAAADMPAATPVDAVETIPEAPAIETLEADSAESALPSAPVQAAPAQAAASALTADPNHAVAVAKTMRPTTIAMLLPADNSPFLSAGKIVSNGLVAASKTSPVPANILMIESPDHVPVDELIDAAVASGADVVVGPLQRERVQALVAKEKLPIPVVALNAVEVPIQNKVPENLLMMSVSTETEAEYVAELAVKTLPPKPEPAAISAEGTAGSTPTPALAAPTETGTSDMQAAPEAPSTEVAQTGATAAEAAPAEAPRAQVAILTLDRPWERRIEEAYKRVLFAAGVTYDVYVLNPEKLSELPKGLEATLDEETSEYFHEREKIIRETYKNDPRRLKRQLRNLEGERRAKIATAEPPYAAIFFALDAQTASLIRNRLPQKSRLWATSSSNPGDPKTSSSAAALAYDLENLVFTESPIVVRYDAQSFEARFGTAMPYSLAAKRLFALGADAYEMAQQWAIGRPIIQFHGESGALEVDRKASPYVKRTPQTIVVKGGHLVEVEPALVSRPGALPPIREKKPAATLDVESREQLRVPLTVAPTVTVETAEDLPPAPPPPARPAQSAPELPPPTPGTPLE